jgi:two-component system, LytTR family, sensor kinase
VLLNPWVGWYAELPPIAALSSTSLSHNLLIYLLMVGVGHALHYWRAAHQQQELLWQAQLRALKSQLRPHFLFNTLNTISSSVRSDPAAAERMIEGLGRLLRHSLDDAHEVSLQLELAALEPYLDIELTRFEDRLTIRQHIEPGVLHAAIPHFMLQPIVENAVLHGIAPRASAGSIDLSVSRENDDVVIQVQNDGAALAPGFSEQDWGIGLGNTRDRLQRLYGARHRIELSAAADGAVRTVVRIPFRSVGV